MLRTLRRITQAPAPNRTGGADSSRQAEPQDASREGPGELAVPPIASVAQTPADETVYFMESPTEGARLELKTDPYRVGQQLLTAGLRHGMRALDIACGSGAVTRIMAHIAGPGCVTGVDRSASRLDEARTRASDAQCDVQFVEGAADALPFADQVFAFTHARMVFQYLRQPARVLDEMKRVTQPGGQVVVVDLDGQIEALHPVPEDVRHDLDTALQLLRGTGFDPQVGRKLVGYFHQAQFEGIQAYVEPYQVYTGGDLSPRDRQNWHEKLDTATRFLAHMTGDTSRWSRFRSAYLAALEAPGAFYYATMMIVRGTVPSAS